MSRGQRLTMFGIAAVIAAVAVVIALASGGDDDKDDAPPSAAAQTTGQSAPDESTTSTPAPPPKPEVERIRIKNGKPVGGVEEIEVESGDRVRIAVTSDVDEELHLHGYDISRRVSAGGTSRFDFKAKIEGVFELELENSGVKLAQLTVKP